MLNGKCDLRVKAHDIKVPNHSQIQTFKFYLTVKFCLTKSEINASFLRAARAGNLDKVLEYLNENIDINISNSVSGVS